MSARPASTRSSTSYSYRAFRLTATCWMAMARAPGLRGRLLRLEAVEMIDGALDLRVVERIVVRVERAGRHCDVGLDADVVDLHALGREPAADGDEEGAAVLQLPRGVHRAFAVARLADDDRAAVVLEGGGE